jgi:hypothetical protein
VLDRYAGNMDKAEAHFKQIVDHGGLPDSALLEDILSMQQRLALDTRSVHPATADWLYEVMKMMERIVRESGL